MSENDALGRIVKEPHDEYRRCIAVDTFAKKWENAHSGMVAKQWATGWNKVMDVMFHMKADTLRELRSMAPCFQEVSNSGHMSLMPTKAYRLAKISEFTKLNDAHVMAAVIVAATKALGRQIGGPNIKTEREAILQAIRVVAPELGSGPLPMDAHSRKRTRAEDMDQSFKDYVAQRHECTPQQLDSILTWVQKALPELTRLVKTDSKSWSASTDKALQALLQADHIEEVVSHSK